MRRRDFLSLAAAGTVAAVAGCSTAAQDDSPQDGTDRPDRSGDPETVVQVGATGSVEAEPDKAVAQVGIEAQGDDVRTVRDELATRAGTVRDALLDAGVPDENIHTGRFDIRQNRREGGFEGIHVYRVEIDDVDRVGELVDVAVDAGADDVGHVRFTLAEETRNELHDEALRAALENARGEAETIADAEGLTITGIQEVTTTRTDVRPHRAEAAAAGDGAGTDLDAGPVTVTAQVTVTYAAESGD